MYLSGHTQQEIADAVGVDKATVNRRLEECCNLDKCPKSNKIAALFRDPFRDLFQGADPITSDQYCRVPRIRADASGRVEP